MRDRQSLSREMRFDSDFLADLSGSYVRLSEIMAAQLRVQNQIVAAQRNRQVSVEKTREQEEIVLQSTEKNRRQLLTPEPERNALFGIRENARAASEAGVALEKMRQSGAGYISETEAGLTRLFRTSFKNELSSADKLWDSFCKSLMNSFSKTVAKIASSWLEEIVGSIFGSAGSLFGGGEATGIGSNAEILHSGGVAGEASVHRVMSPLLFAAAPRFHSGLAPDEFPAVLQKGERVIPRGNIPAGAPAQQPAPTVNIVINDYSAQGIATDEKQVTWDPYENVLAVVLEASEKDPRFHDAVKRANRM